MAETFYDGYFDGEGRARPACVGLVRQIEALGGEGLRALQGTAEVSLLNQGITFTVYADDRGTEKIMPFDILPRVVTAGEWERVERGMAQRLRALNRFLADIYSEQRILKDGVVPGELIVGSAQFCRPMWGIEPPGGVFVHVSGTDLIQDESGRFVVLEDNLRVPSGVSYLIENRRVMSRVMPDLMRRYRVQRVDHYPRLLLECLQAISRREEARVAVLTPGSYNSAYFEHSFLAAQMGVELVEGSDLVVDRERLFMKTTAGLEPVDVLYRRVDDSFLDPVVFRPDSLLGVPGLMHAYRAGHLVLANAPGTGVADDKATYAYVPEMIRYYLGEEPVLDQIPTYLCRDEEQRRYVIEHLEELVVKPTDGSGGYGVVVGPHASAAEREQLRSAILADPERFIAQPVQALSTLPTLVLEGRTARMASRHVDLRPFALFGPDERVDILPGGLTRVALEQGSLIVNSSQGGGSKDTWVLHGQAEAADA
ncbi:MAG: circularly permuted type 2 ATP-grasp protein [Proteobacteria bacterium]|nr:circularly permuted type 2 ATP-grasp protein [Pseudomonadota bacterium]